METGRTSAQPMIDRVIPHSAVPAQQQRAADDPQPEVVLSAASLELMLPASGDGSLAWWGLDAEYRRDSFIHHCLSVFTRICMHACMNVIYFVW